MYRAFAIRSRSVSGLVIPLIALSLSAHQAVADSSVSQYAQSSERSAVSSSHNRYATRRAAPKIMRQQAAGKDPYSLQHAAMEQEADAIHELSRHITNGNDESGVTTQPVEVRTLTEDGSIEEAKRTFDGEFISAQEYEHVEPPIASPVEPVAVESIDKLGRGEDMSSHSVEPPLSGDTLSQSYALIEDVVLTERFSGAEVRETYRADVPVSTGQGLPDEMYQQETLDVSLDSQEPESLIARSLAAQQAKFAVEKEMYEQAPVVEAEQASTEPQESNESEGRGFIGRIFSAATAILSPSSVEANESRVALTQPHPMEANELELPEHGVAELGEPERMSGVQELAVADNTDMTDGSYHQTFPLDETSYEQAIEGSNNSQPILQLRQREMTASDFNRMSPAAGWDGNWDPLANMQEVELPEKVQEQPMQQPLPPEQLPPQMPNAVQPQIEPDIAKEVLKENTEALVQKAAREVILEQEKVAPPTPVEDVTIERFPESTLAMEADEEIAEKNGMKVATKERPFNMNGHLEAAYESLLVGDTAMAVEHYRAVQARFPNNVDAMFGLATTYHRIGEIERAKDLYNRILDIQPSHLETLNNVLVLATEEAPREALKELLILEMRNPRYDPISAQIAAVYARLGRLDLAIDKIKRAIYIAPENLHYRYNLAVLLDHAERYEEAIAVYKGLKRSYETGLPIPADIASIQERLTFLLSNKPS